MTGEGLTSAMRRRAVRVALVVEIFVMVGCSGGAEDPRPPELPGLSCATDLEQNDGLLVGGSGSALALMRTLIRRYRVEHPDARVTIPESIGTRGAARAVADGVVAIGLGSRPLTSAELEMGLAVTPLADSVVAFVAHRDVPTRSLSTSDLVAIYRGEMAVWTDGTPLVPLLREEGDSSNQVVRASRPELFAAMQDARREGRGIVCLTDQEMRDTLLSVEGSIGLLDVGIVRLERLPLDPILLDGVEPTRAEALAGRYPLVKELFLITRAGPEGPGEDARQLVDFSLSAENGDLIESGDYLRPGRH